jgi:hypothetical protein
MISLKQFVSKQIESAAYHEAGHIIAAVVQAMPIRASGMYVDLSGCGVANYFDRPESDLEMTALDMIERKRTIIALYSAHPAQLRFYPEVEKSGWMKDLVRIGTLSRQLHPTDEDAQIAVRKELLNRAERLVDKFWPIVEELATALLAKSPTPMPPEEIAVKWGTGPVRNLSGSEIAGHFAKHNIHAIILDQITQRYESTQAVPHYDSLA